MTSQLETFIHNGAEFVRREQDLLLHDIGVPTLTVPLAGRPVVLAAPARDLTQQMKALRPFIREQDPVVVAVGAAADILASAGFKARVVVVGGIDDELPRAKVLKKAREVVAVVDRGAPQVSTERLERLGLRPHRFETGASLEDAALILVDHGQPSLIVGAGTGATLPDFLDRARPGVASAFVTRLRVGSRLIDAAAVPQLYDGAVRPRHLAGVLLAGIVALGAAVSVTPVGQEWFDALMPALQSVPDHVRGLIP